MSQIDVRDLELPTYVSADEISSQGRAGKMRVRIREFPGRPPIIVEINPEWTPSEVEERLSIKLGKNPRTTRLLYANTPLPSNTTFAELSRRIDFNNATLDLVPEHSVG